MRFKGGKYFTAIVVCLVLAACSAVKKSADDSKDCDTKIKRDKTIEELAFAANSSFNWMKSKADIAVDIEGESYTFGASVRMKKDSVIWLSLTKAGIGFAKVLLTEDSVKYLDKMSSKYYSGDYTYINNLLKQEVNFQMIQSILLGSVSNIETDKKYNAYTEKDNYLYCTPRKMNIRKVLKDSIFDNDKDKVHAVWLTCEKFQVERVLFQDPVAKQELNVIYSDRFEEYASIPKQLELTTKDGEGKRNTIEITYYNLSLSNESIKMKFSIPEDYEEIH